MSGSETLKVPDDVAVMGALSLVDMVDMLLTDSAARSFVTCSIVGVDVLKGVDRGLLEPLMLELIGSRYSEGDSQSVTNSSFIPDLSL